MGNTPPVSGAREHRVDVDQAREHARMPLLEFDGGARDDHAAVAVPDQHDVLELFHLDQADDIGDVRVQVDVGSAQVCPLAVAGQGHGVDLEPGIPQRRQHAPPDPAASPGAMDQNKGGGG